MGYLRIFMVVLSALCLTALSKCPKQRGTDSNQQLAPVPLAGVDQVDYQLGCPAGTAANTTAATIHSVQALSLNAFCTSLPGSLPGGTGPALQDPRYHLVPGNFVGPLKITPNCQGRVLTIESSGNTVVASFASDGTFIIPNISVSVPFTDDKFNRQKCMATLVATLHGMATCPEVATGNMSTVFQNAVIAMTVDWGYQSVSIVPTIPSQPRTPATGSASRGEVPCNIASTCTTSQAVSLSCGR